MCRLAAYAGQPLSLRRLLLEPTHSLYEQSYAPREMIRGLLCADGYGFGWYDTDDQPRVYAHTLPIWSDTNLPDLADTLTARLWLANVRSATPGQAVNPANTQPFRAGNLMYLHNGYLEGFNNGLRAHFHRHLDAELTAGLQGNCDSEYLFALIRQHLKQQSQRDLAGAIDAAINDLEAMLDGRQALLGLILTDGSTLYALRHGIGCPPPSMYSTTADPAYPGALVIASERLTEGEHWQALTTGKVMVAATDAPFAASA